MPTKSAGARHEQRDKPRTSDPRPPDDAVDVHGHAVPMSLLRDVAGRSGGLHGVTAAQVGDDWHVEMPQAPVTRVVRPGMRDADRRRHWLAERGIGLQVLSPWLDVQLSPGMSSQEARDWTRRLNDAMVAEAASPTGPQPTLASLALHRPEQAADDLVEAVRSQGMAGLLLNTHPAERALTDPEMEPVWGAAEELGVPVVLHPPTEGPHSALPEAAAYGNAFGRLIDSTLVLSSLLLGGLLDRHPQLVLVAVHGGGFLPYQSKRLDGARRVGPLAQHSPERGDPSEYLPSLYFDTVALSASSIALLTQVAGPDHVLLGTDYPFPLGDQTPVETVREVGLPPGETQMVLRDNALELFRRTAA